MTGHGESLQERFEQAQQLSDKTQMVAALESLQAEIALCISSNEDLNDIATSNLPYLSLEHLLAEAYVDLPMQNGMGERLGNLRRACDLWQAFFERLERLDLLSVDEKKQLRALLEVQESLDDNNDNQTPILSPPVSREMKIARFQMQKEAQQEKDRLQSLQERRRRLNIAQNETMDGHDDESLERSIALTITGKIHKVQAFDGWGSVLQELPLCARMAREHSQNQSQEHRYTSPPQRPPQGKGLQVTQITQDITTGQLRLERQEIKADVLRPGWNLPTMTLEELGERELQQALAREQAQKEAELERALAPRRYEFLVRDGLEDDADLVDASAALDRNWDDFKDENPRGSGNKRGDVGDRNF
jgi:hypothetical protein